MYNESAVPHCQFSCNNTLILNNGYCIGFDNVTKMILMGSCPYSSYYQFQNISTIKSPITQMKLCVDFWIDKTFFVANVSLVMGFQGCRWMCTMWLYLVLPITLFYVTVIIFNFSATHPPVNAYIFYCQLFTQVIYNVRFITNRIFLHLTMTVNDVRKLDMLRYVIPSFCLSERLSNTDVLD